MKFPQNPGLSRVAEKLRGLFQGPPVSEAEAIALHPGCIARQYAQCNDYAHCRQCGTIEQSLRAASWIEFNWRRMEGRRQS